MPVASATRAALAARRLLPRVLRAPVRPPASFAARGQVHTAAHLGSGAEGNWLADALGTAPGARAPASRRLDRSAHIFALEGALTPAECAAIVRAAEGEGFRVAGVDARATRSAQDPEQVTELRTDVRSNERIVLDSPKAAAKLFARLAIALPQVFRGLTLDSFNDRIRVYKYSPGQFFTPHVDGALVDGLRGTEFVFTVLLYLNDVERGGRTMFHIARSDSSGAGGLRYTPASSPAPVEARVGQGLAFFRKTPHSGEAVLRGSKYVLRLDAMYR